MTTKINGRIVGCYPTQNNSDNNNPAEISSQLSWFGLAKSSRINRLQKRVWQEGRK
jgi:hypothetical protein